MENNGIQNYAEGFKVQYEQFVNSCDAAEEAGLWNLEEYGEMEGYYFNILMGIILHTISADGNIAEAEVEYLNTTFGFDYTVDSLLEVYYSVGRDIEQNYLENAKVGLDLLKGMNKELADEYLDLVNLICKIIAESDAGVNEEELRTLQEMHRKL